MNFSSLNKAWYSIPLKNIRDASSTYACVSYDTLPPIPTTLSADFAWLTPLEPCTEYQHAQMRVLDQIHADIPQEGVDFSSQLMEWQQQAGISFPPSFITFLSTPSINRRIRSVTDCYFELGDYVERVSEDTYLLHFMSDSQYCLFWYLGLTSTGEQCIIFSDTLYGHYKQPTIEHGSKVVYYCAASFTEFIYRIAIENKIWFKTSWYKAALTEEEQTYAGYYH